MKMQYEFEMKENSCMCCPFCLYEVEFGEYYCILGIDGKNGKYLDDIVDERPEWCILSEVTE